MFKVNQVKDKVNVEIHPQVPGAEGWYITLTRNENNEMDAALLANAINEHRRKVLRRIREDAYQQGWKDAKAKNKKQTWFAEWF